MSFALVSSSRELMAALHVGHSDHRRQRWEQADCVVAMKVCYSAFVNTRPFISEGYVFQCILAFRPMMLTVLS